MHTEVGNPGTKIGKRMRNPKPFKHTIKRIEYVFIIVIRWTEFCPRQQNIK